MSASGRCRLRRTRSGRAGAPGPAAPPTRRGRSKRTHRAQVARRAILPDLRLVLVLMPAHALEARPTARRRHEREPLGRRGRPGLVCRERLERRSDPRLRRLNYRRSRRPSAPCIAQGRLLRRPEGAQVLRRASGASCASRVASTGRISRGMARSVTLAPSRRGRRRPCTSRGTLGLSEQRQLRWRRQQRVQRGLVGTAGIGNGGSCKYTGCQR